jgi:hypothetical protein
VSGTVLNNARPAEGGSGCTQDRQELRIEISATHPLGRMLIITQPDGSTVAAESWEPYRGHLRTMAARTIEERIALLESLQEGGRFLPLEVLCLEIDQHLRPGWLLELHLLATRLQRYRPGTRQNRDGRRLRKLLVNIEQRFRGGGARGFGRANRVEGDRLPPTRLQPRTGQLETAKSLIQALLANGTRIPARVVWSAAGQAGISKPTLNRAAAALGVRKGGGRGSTWSLEGTHVAQTLSASA